MSSQSIKDVKYLSIRAGIIPVISASTECFFTYGNEDHVTIIRKRVHIAPEETELSLKEINRRLHSVDTPLAGGRTGEEEEQATAS